MEGEKICRLCHQPKPLSEFYKMAKAPDGVGYVCKPCSRARTLAWKKANPEKAAEAQRRYLKSDKGRAMRKARREGPNRERILEQKRDYHARNRDAINDRDAERRREPDKREAARQRAARWKLAHPRGRHAHQIERLYGISLEQWDERVIAQSGRCMICSDELRRPQVDHDHVTGAIRGILCTSCNTALGSFRDRTDLMLAAIAYLT